MQVMSRIALVVCIACGAVSLALQPGIAAAQQGQTPTATTSPDGFYYLLNFGLGDAENPQTNADFGVDLDWSWHIGFGLGYRFGPVRLEAELGDRFLRVGSLDLGPTSPFPVDDYAGGMHAYSAMGNLYVDLPMTGRLQPYLGVGLGMARVTAEYNESVCIIYCFSTENSVVDDWHPAAAWQAMGGLTFRGWSPTTEWFIGYRYFETGNLDFTTTGGQPFRQDGLQDHSITGGFRFFI